MKWEYLVFDASEIDLQGRPPKVALQETLNRIGKDGWELVLAGSASTYIFKRPRIENQDPYY